MKEYFGIIIMALGIISAAFILIENENTWPLVLIIYFSGICAGEELIKMKKKYTNDH